MSYNTEEVVYLHLDRHLAGAMLLLLLLPLLLVVELLYRNHYYEHLHLLVLPKPLQDRLPKNY